MLRLILSAVALVGVQRHIRALLIPLQQRRLRAEVGSYLAMRDPNEEYHQRSTKSGYVCR
jgi:hypothetical protein